jgi:hypothetical protein
MPELNKCGPNPSPCSGAVVGGGQWLCGDEAAPHGKLLHHENQRCEINLSRIGEKGSKGEKETAYRPERLCDCSDEEGNTALVFQRKHESILKFFEPNGYDTAGKSHGRGFMAWDGHLPWRWPGVAQTIKNRA